MTKRDPIRENIGAYRPHIDEIHEPIPADVMLELIDQLQERLGWASLADLERLGPGICDDCGLEHRRRYRYGDFGLVLCRRHATARARCQHG
jgi:hypothetical protein